MDVVVQHKTRSGEISSEFTVKEGTAIDYVACVPCRGTGSRFHTVGGNLHYLGWQLWQDFGCPHCRCAGAFRADQL